MSLIELRREISDLRTQLNQELSAHIYISKSEKQIIFAPVRYMGFSVEQDDVTILPYGSSPALIGQTAFSVLTQFKVTNVEKIGANWAAYKASGLRTKKEFERRYTFIQLGTTHPCLYFQIIGNPVSLKKEHAQDLTVNALISLLWNEFSDEVLANKILQVYQACIALDEHDLLS
ncbi:MAG: hypothetical protein H6Q71_6 [Firmicutes bacterium]|nr:hypothetical protein [Bacillota bacterium]